MTKWTKKSKVNSQRFIMALAYRVANWWRWSSHYYCYNYYFIDIKIFFHGTTTRNGLQLFTESQTCNQSNYHNSNIFSKNNNNNFHQASVQANQQTVSSIEMILSRNARVQCCFSGLHFVSLKIWGRKINVNDGWLFFRFAGGILRLSRFPLWCMCFIGHLLLLNTLQ